MKKYCALIISCLLVLFSLFFSIDFNSIMVGKGGEKDEEISNINVMSNVLKTFCDSYNNNAYSSSSYDLKSVEGGNEKKITSISLEIDSAGKFENNVREGSNLESAVNSYNRKLNVYFTDDAAYYTASMDLISKVSSRKNGESTSENYSMNIEFELYFAQDYVAVRFQKFHVVSESGVLLDAQKSKLNVWYKADGVESELLDINERNIALLSYYGDIFENKNVFYEKNSLYAIKPEYTKNALKDIYKVQSGYSLSIDENDEYTFELSLDLSNKKSPVIKQMMSVNNDKTFNGGYWNDYSTYSQESSGNGYDIIKIKNINNTVIKIPNNLELKEMTNE